jgi:hypothetical protein
MQRRFNKCPNGHYYQGATCPYCPRQATTGDSPTQIVDGDTKHNSMGGVGNAPTQ